MKRPAKTLPIKPPRTHNLRDAYRGRVWRTPWTVVARELFFWALGLTLLSVAVNDVRWMLYRMVAVILLESSPYRRASRRTEHAFESFERVFRPSEHWISKTNSVPT